ncbi:MAG: type I restriction enzyme HsdR N-terminal domain-containing protein [Caldilineaceae bacterium]|nr:type I restriction enzyme HsdR N-terminal domain-containing protein [Caldilineaceae bacterium]
MDVYIIVILFLLVACLGLAYETRKRGEDLERHQQAHEAEATRLRREVDGARQAHQKEVAQLRARQQREMEQVSAAHRAEMERLRESHRQEQARQPVVQPNPPRPAGVARSDARTARHDWLNHLPGAIYENEAEVEAKFVFPLVQSLGYSVRDFSRRVPVGLRLGEQALAGEADWVLWEAAKPGADPSALAVIEVSAPDQALDDGVQTRARSYAFGVGAPVYLITNGKQLQLFRRDVRTDPLLLECKVEEFAACWQHLYDLLGVHTS